MGWARAVICTLAMVASVPGLAVAAVASRAPTPAEYSAITSAFKHDSRPGHRHADDRIIEIRVTAHGVPVTHVFFVRRLAHVSTSRANGDIGQCGSCSDYYFKASGQWKPDPKVTKALRDQLREIIPAWDIDFKGSVRGDLSASAPGDVASNPYCEKPPVVESDGSSLHFEAGFGPVGVDGLSDSGVGKTTGSGSYRLQQQPGCVNNSNPVAPQTSSCSADFFTPIFARGAVPHVQLSGLVDRRRNHELRLNAPVPAQRPADCAAPNAWLYWSDGPFILLHSVLVPDAQLARGSSFTIKANAKKSFPCFAPEGYANAKCSETATWSGTIQVTPLPDWRKLNWANL